jgi:hypothetical protein
MKPIRFEQQTNDLQPNAAGHGGYTVYTLPVWTDGEQVVSCWKMSLRERISAIVFGRVWLSLLTGSRTSPPVYAQVSSHYFVEKKI